MTALDVTTSVVSLEVLVNGTPVLEMSVPVIAPGGGGGGAAWGEITGTLADQADLAAALAAKATAAQGALADTALQPGEVVSTDIIDFGAAVAATAAVAANTAKQTNATHTGDATGGTVLTLATVNANVGSFGLAGSVAQFVVNAKGLITSAVNVAISIAAAAINDATAAGRAMLMAADAAAQTALLDEFTDADKGLVPPSGGGTTNFLRADGSFAAPLGGPPGGAVDELQFNDGAGGFAGAANVLVEGDELRLPAIASPAAPVAGGLKLFGLGIAGRSMPAFKGLSGLDVALQPHFGRGRFAMLRPTGNNTAITNYGWTSAATGTATAANVATTNRHTRMARIEYLVTVAATTAVAGFRGNALQWTLGASSEGDGGFHMSLIWAPATGVSNATNRAFAGMRGSVAAPTDVEPSTLTNICGMGWDAADANIQFMRNDGAGGATKIDLGASFPVPTVDRTSVYRIELYAPPGPTQSLSYEITDLVSGAVAIGTVTTDLPATSQLLAPYSYVSVGGTSSVVGIAVMGLTIESDY